MKSNEKSYLHLTILHIALCIYMKGVCKVVRSKLVGLSSNTFNSWCCYEKYAKKWRQGEYEIMMKSNLKSYPHLTILHIALCIYIIYIIYMYERCLKSWTLLWEREKDNNLPWIIYVSYLTTSTYLIIVIIIEWFSWLILSIIRWVVVGVVPPPAVVLSIMGIIIILIPFMTGFIFIPVLIPFGLWFIIVFIIILFMNAFIIVFIPLLWLFSIPELQLRLKLEQLLSVWKTNVHATYFC